MGASQQAKRVTEPIAAVPTVEQFANADNLITTFYQLKGKAGQAPGPVGAEKPACSNRELTLASHGPMLLPNCYQSPSTGSTGDRTFLREKGRSVASSTWLYAHPCCQGS